MKITTLMENSLQKDKELYKEHGISFFIETENENILFDTGKTGKFVDNAKKLNIDLNKTNYLVLSHSHYDHCGGVKNFLDNFNVSPELYVSKKFFTNSNKYYYSDGSKKLDFAQEVGYNYIGIDFDEKYIKDKNVKINLINEDITKLNDKVYIFGNFEKLNDFETRNLNMKIKKEEEYIVDTFEEEVVMGFDTEKGLVILLGCSHPGILNIIDTIVKRTGKKIYAVLGGTHLVEANEKRINKTIEHLEKLDIKVIGVSHCTGEKAIEMFKEKCEDFFIDSTGTVVEFK